MAPAVVWMLVGASVGGVLGWRTAAPRRRRVSLYDETPVDMRADQYERRKRTRAQLKRIRATVLWAAVGTVAAWGLSLVWS